MADESENDRLARAWWRDRDKEGFKKPFKAVPLQPERLRGLDELDAPLWSHSPSPEPINWTFVAVGLFMGVCLGLAYVIWARG